MRERRIKDRRVRRTQSLVREALAALLHEKPYDDIAVKEILERASVGRSTFYTHFRDKDELLLSSIHEMLRSARPVGGEALRSACESLVWFSRPILEHIEQHRRTGEGSMGPRGRRAMHEHLQRAITELIEDEVKTGLGHTRHGADQISPELLAGWIASTFVLVLNWWVESDSPPPAHDADSLFRRLIEPSLAGIIR